MHRFLAPVLLLAGLGLAQENYTTNWSGHRTQFINTLSASAAGTNIGANVLKYPMLVRLGVADSAVFAASKAGGADIRFTKSNNTTRLQYSIDQWDSASRRASIWVLIDTVYANNGTQSFRLHWGNAAAVDSQKTSTVFDTANGFTAVWHMGDSTGAKVRPNSVVGGNPAVPAASSGELLTGFTQRVGLIGWADTLRSQNSSNANDDHFTLGTGYQFAKGAGTLSVWTKILLPSTGWNNIIALSAGTAGTGANKNQGGLTDNIFFSRNGTSNDLSYRSSNGGIADSGLQSTQITGTGALLPIDTWANFTATWADSGRTRKLYKNGVELGSLSVTAPDSINIIRGVTRGAGGLTFLGRSAWGDRNYRGLIDEVRFSNLSRSVDWIKLDFGSQSPTASLVTDTTLPAISYALDSATFTAGFAATPITAPSLTGVPHPTVSVSPALPLGLTLTTALDGRGQITGSPSTASLKTKYVITATNAKGTSSDSIWLTVIAPSVTEDYTTWTSVKTMTFTGAAAGITAPVNRFPLLVRLGAGDAGVFTNGGTNGANVRFSKPDGAKLPYAIDQWDSAGAKASIWVLLDQAVTGTNSVRIHWNKAGATSQSSGPAVFERSNGYVTVHHLGDASDTAVARINAVTPGTNDAIPTNFGASYVAKQGIIGTADTLVNTGNTLLKTNGGDYLNYGTLDSTLFNASGTATVSMWAKATSLPTAFMQYFTMGNTVSNAGSAAMWLGKNGTATNRLAGQNITAGSNTGVVAGGNNTAIVGAWQHITFTVNGSSHRLYSNGVLVTASTTGPVLGRTIRTANFIGASTWPDPTFDGVVDEARLSNVDRSADFIALEYATQRANVGPVSFSYAPSARYSPNSALTINPVGGITGMKFTISPALPTGLTFDTLTGAISGTPTAASTVTYTVSATNGPWTGSAMATINVADVDGAYATAWTGHSYVSLNTFTAGVVTTQTNFPVLIRLGVADSAVFNASQASGADIRFTKVNGTTRLQHEIDSWNKTARSASIWVLMDSVYGNSTGSRLMMHYGNANVGDSSKSASVFTANAGFVSVHHLGNPVGGNAQTGIRPNSALPGTNDATPVNFTSTQVLSTGAIGMADTLVTGTGGANPTGQFLNFGTVVAAAFTANGGATLSLWAKPKTLGTANAYVQMFTTGNTAGGNNSGGVGNNSLWIGKVGNNATGGQATTAGTNRMGGQVLTTTENVRPTFGTDNTVSIGDWQLLAFVADNMTHTVYRNGVAVGTRADGQPLSAIDRTASYIGRATWPDGTFDGVVDEARLSKVARSADWLKLEYANQNAAQNLVAFSPTLIAPVVGINAASASMLGGQVLGFKAMGKGLLFQVHGEASSKVRIAIVDMFGRTVWNRTTQTGTGMNQIVWDGNSSNGMAISSGIYVVRMNLLDATGKPAAGLTRKVPLTH